MKILAAAIQMSSEPLNVSANLAKADEFLREAHEAGSTLAVLPEMFNTGYSLLPDYGPSAEGREGPTLRHLAMRAREWNMAIAGGFVERDAHHLYDSIAFAMPDGQLHVYRKRNLVFWERFRFKPGRSPLVVATPWGRIGFAVCADMIYKKVWDDYRGRIDLALVCSAWPDFADRETGRKHWLFGHVGPLSGAIPGKVAVDLGIPVVFANQCGHTSTIIPILGTKISDRFAGLSSICDGLHAIPTLAGFDEQILFSTLTVHPSQGLRTWRSTSNSAPVASFSGSERS